MKVLGKPVAYNSDDTCWGYWTRGLPNPKMGILVIFRQDTVQEIQLSEDWSKLAAVLARP